MLTDYAEEALLNHLFRNVPLTSPTTVYVGIALSGGSVETELEAGTLTSEITGYTGDRKPITFTAPVQNNGGYIENEAQIDFEGMPATTVGYTFISDSPTKGAGNIVDYAPIVDANGDPTTRAIQQDGILRLLAGSIRVRAR